MSLCANLNILFSNIRIFTSKKSSKSKKIYVLQIKEVHTVIILGWIISNIQF
jgi:hypothetical protein